MSEPQEISRALASSYFVQIHHVQPNCLRMVLVFNSQWADRINGHSRMLRALRSSLAFVAP